MSNPVKRAKEILHGLRWAFGFDNGWEIIADRHVFRRSDPIRLQLNGLSVIVNAKSSDIQAVKDVLQQGMYDEPLKASMEGKKSFRYLNLGANIGTFDLRAFQIARTLGLRVSGTSVEMNPTAHSRLILNLELNRIEGVVALNAALQDTDGRICIDVFERDTGQSATAAKEETPWRIPTRTWDSLWNELEHKELDLLKVDIEGGEIHLLENLSRQQAEKIQSIVIETHGESLHKLCDEKLPASGFKRLDREATSSAARLSYWQRTT